MKTNTTRINLFSALLIGGFMAALPASAAVMSPSTILLGSDNSGDGGFTTSGATWSTQTDALRLTATNTSPATAQALQEYTIDTTPGNSYNVFLSTKIITEGGGNSNRYGIRLFASSDSDTSNGIGIIFGYSNVNAALNSLTLRDAAFGGSVEDSDTWGGVNNSAVEGKTFTFSGSFTYVGSNIDLSFQVTDGIDTSTVTGSVAAASYTGSFFGFGSRSEDGATIDYNSFSVIPEPSSLVLIGITAMAGLLLLRRRR